jgi:signal transduction histidine kinase
MKISRVSSVSALSIVGERGAGRLRPGAAFRAAAIVVARAPAYRDRTAGGAGPTASAVVRLPAGPGAAYSRLVRSFISRLLGWCRRLVTRHHAAAVITGTVVMFGCGLTTAVTHPPVRISRAELVIAAVTYAVFAVVAVARWPAWLLVAVAAAGAVASMAAGAPDVVITSALYIAVLAFSLASELTRTIAGTVAAIAVLGAGHLAFSLPVTSGWSDLDVLPWLAVVAAVGMAIRARRMQRAMLAERARHAEELREAGARRRIQERVQEERLRIARELHDAVGHQVALISVQAGAMGFLLGADADSADLSSASLSRASLSRARESLAHIQRASAAALEELRLTVGLLRQPGDSEPTEPAAGLGGLEELIGSFTATGLSVTCEVTGPAGPLPEAVDLTAYRVIQESLTNTAKHAAGASASVRLAFRPGVLALTVEDDGGTVDVAAPHSPAPTHVNHADVGHADVGHADVGHGLIGMRERAVAVGGWVTAGPRDGGGYQVVAELPLPNGSVS